MKSKWLIICTECKNMIDIIDFERYMEGKKKECLDCKLNNLTIKMAKDEISKPFIGFSNITS